MKKQLLTLLFCAIASMTIAQSFGIRAGANIATQNIDADGLSIEPDSRTGLYLGLISKFGLTDALDLRVELNYCQYGFNFDDDLFGEQTFSVNHLDIPILIQYDLNIGDALGAYLAAGPQIGYALSAKNEVDGEDVDFEFDDAEYKRLDFGLAFGGGFGFGIAGDNMLYLELRYVLGLANLNDGDDDATVTNRGLQVGLAYML